MVIHQPFTMLWPTDTALSSLPAERQRWLSSPDHRDQLAAIVKAHVIRNAMVCLCVCVLWYMNQNTKTHISIGNGGHVCNI